MIKIKHHIVMEYEKVSLIMKKVDCLCGQHLIIQSFALPKPSTTPRISCTQYHTQDIQYPIPHPRYLVPTSTTPRLFCTQYHNQDIHIKNQVPHQCVYQVLQLVLWVVVGIPRKLKHVQRLKLTLKSAPSSKKYCVMKKQFKLFLAGLMRST